MKNMNEQIGNIEENEDGVDLARRRALGRLGLTAAVAYAAPSLLQLTAAAAKDGSGGDDSGGDDSGDDSSSSPSSDDNSEGSDSGDDSSMDASNSGDDEATLPSESSDSSSS